MSLQCRRGRKMLSFFPSLYEDEMLYSWFARYHVRSCNVSPKATMKDLFGSINTIAVPDLPTHLDRIYERIKHFEVPEIDSWLDKHTLFRYYTTFTNAETKKAVYDAMITGNRPGAIHMMTGMMASNVSEPSYFRYCQDCVEDDFQQYGETYWHVSQQLPGVMVCLKHDCLLQNASVPFRGQNKHVYVPATRDNSNSSEKTPHFSEKTMYYLKAVSKDSIRLINGDFQFTWQGIQQAYRYMLQKHGYATVKGSVDQRTLAEQFRRFYGEELLKTLQSPVDPDNSSCWLKAITRKHRKSFHPIRHLLFIHFFGETVESFYQYATQEYQPFWESPYVCLNAAADHYLQPVIPNVKVTICTDTRRPVGTFACSCGFSYSRRGPDQKKEDRYKIGRIKQFGPVWEQKLHELIHVQKLSYHAAAKQLHVDISTAKKYANRSEEGKNRKVPNDIQLLGEQRKLWLQLQQHYPHASVTQLRHANKALYTWLYRHDKQWLLAYSPKEDNVFQTHQRVNWTERDRNVLKEVQTTVERLLLSNKPVHINISRIGKEIKKLVLLERHLDKLPQTNAYLNNAVETQDQFQIRRVRWAAKELYQNHMEVNEWRIQRLAGLKSNIPDDVRQEVRLQENYYCQLLVRKEV